MSLTSMNIEGYVPSPASITKDDNLVIVELTNKELKLLGQLAHMYLMNSPESTLASALLSSLATQCDSVKLNPEDHKVFQAERAPYDAVRSEGAWIVPFEEMK